MELMESCAARINRGLALRNMKQADLCRLTGIPKSAMSQYCQGAFVPKQDRTYLIAKALRVSEAWLMGHDVSMEPQLPTNVFPAPQMRRVPVLGCIRAGMPVLAQENIEGYEYADVPEGHEYYFLRVKGDSMINARICDGDLALIKQQPCADDGQIVACLVNGDEATLKRFYRQKDMVILKPENSSYSPIIVPCTDFENGYAKILGVVSEIKFKL